MKRLNEQPHERPSDVFKRLTDQRNSRKSSTLTEASDPQEFKKGDRVRHAVGDVRVGAARVLSHGEGEVFSTPNAWDRTVRVLWDRAGGKIQSVPYGEIEKVTR